MSRELEVSVKISYENNPNGDLIIAFPIGQPKLTVTQTAHLLAAGLSLLIKGSGNTDLGVNEVDLLREMINHLETEFASAESYANAILDVNVFKKE